MQILVIEDEVKLAKALRDGLEGDGYAVSVAYTGEEGFYRLNTESFDLVVLDVMLPGHDGFEILATLRKKGVRSPVLLLTAKDSVEDRVHGLDAGADDYLTKPFAFPELLARVRVLLRRSKTDNAAKLEIGDLEIDGVRRTAMRGGQALDLTPREFDILEYLLRHHGRVVSREMLAREIWKVARDVPMDNVIDVHMARLRHKLDDQFGRKFIETVRGVGFLLRAAAQEAAM